MQVHWKPFFALAAAVMMLGFAGRDSSTAAAPPEQTQRAYGQIDLQRLLAVDQHPEEWLTTGRDVGKSHYSPLSQINRKTVSRLGFAWEYATHTLRGLEATPIVVDGEMYTTGSGGKAYALDARIGKELWYFDPKNDFRIARRSCCDIVNRGVAVWMGKVYVASFDGRLFALDATSGQVIWQTDTIVDHNRGYSVTGAPEIAGHAVVIGNAGAEYDARGYVSAYDLETGKLVWRFFTVPGDPSKPFENPELEIAAKTWDPRSNWAAGGGGTVWDAISYDPELNLVYFGTGNGTFRDQSKRSSAGGDNLFIASILAVNADTGRLVWHYQEAPGEEWDYDTVQPFILTDLKINGQPRKVLMQASKTGFFYILDRKTGEVLSAEKFVPVTWADRVDLNTGRPIETAGARNYKNNWNGPSFISPSPAGGHNWNAMAYDPQTGLVYIPAIENGQTALFSGKGFLRAWDPIRSKVVWDVPMAGYWDHAGVLATGGSLVFQGTGSGHFRAYDAERGKLLRDIDVGTSIMAAPMTYAIGGVQYVAVMAAWGGAEWSQVHPEAAYVQRENDGRILVFKLDGKSTPKPAMLPPVGPIPQPPAQSGSAETIKRGATLFSSNCGFCHVNQTGSLAPDLRRMPPGVHQDFQQIVRGGVLANAGMPPFESVLSPEDASAIHNYLISQAWDAYKAQQAARKN